MEKDILKSQKQVEKKLAELKLQKNKENFDKIQNELEKVQELKKSKFYKNSNNELIEQIANYKNFAICIKSNSIQDLDTKEKKLSLAIIDIKDLGKLKKINNNKIKKLGSKIEGLGIFEKTYAIAEAVEYIAKKENNENKN